MMAIGASRVAFVAENNTVALYYKVFSHDS